MLTFDEARRTAEYLKARAEVERSVPAGFAALLVFAALSVAFPHEDSLAWYACFFGGLLVAPWILRALLPKGNRLVYVLALLAYPVNGLLLAFILYRELWKGDPFAAAEAFPQWSWLCPLITVLVPAVYYILQFTEWKRRLLRWPEMRKLLADPPDPVHVGVLEGMVKRVTGRSRPKEAQWAEFRTVPASPRNWRLFLKLDLERHGVWRVAFEFDFAVVVFKDGTGCEAVPLGGLRMATDELKPGAKQVLCLARWNQHLKEGRILPEHFIRIREWNAGRA